MKLDLRDRVVGRLTVVGPAKPRDGKWQWLCRCECGKQVIVDHKSLRKEWRRSCGCLRRKAKTHGMSRSPTYRSWDAMMQRCYNPKNIGYGIYGGRGIRVCQRWHLFENFLADMGLRPKGKTVDRLKSAKDYSPDNCRWATGREQRLNRVRRQIAFNGKSQGLFEWSLEIGISNRVLRDRLRRGWTVDRAFTTPVRK